MANVGDRVTVFAFAALLLAAIVGIAFLVGYVLGRILL